jgi:hypothetical protein
MGMALDELHANDEKIEVNGLSFIISEEVKDMLKYYGNVKIDYMDSPFNGKGFKVSLEGASSCS